MTRSPKRYELMSLLSLKGVIRNGRVEVIDRIDLPEGTAVVVSADDGPMSPDEIARVHARMQTLLPLDIPADVAADLDAWERKLDQHGIDNAEAGLGEVFR